MWTAVRGLWGGECGVAFPNSLVVFVGRKINFLLLQLGRHETVASDVNYLERGSLVDVGEEMRLTYKLLLHAGFDASLRFVCHHQLRQKNLLSVRLLN